VQQKGCSMTGVAKFHYASKENPWKSSCHGSAWDIVGLDTSNQLKNEAHIILLE
jgi:Rieske Fe-S protein